MTTDSEGHDLTADDAASSDTDALVHVDRIGQVRSPWSDAPARVLAVDLPEAARQRLVAAGDCELLDDLAQAERADVAVVSTRMPRPQLHAVLAALRDSGCRRVIALVHTGGEALAVEVVRSGGAGVVAEGNERALRPLLSGEVHDASLVETYDRQFGQSRTRVDPGRGRDLATRLPGRTVFEQHLADLAEAGETPRLAFVRLLRMTGDEQRLSATGTALLRRRLAVQFRQLAAAHDAELYAIDDTDFALLGPTLSPNGAEALGLALARVAETFAPSGHHALALAMGHAGPESATDVPTLRELAQRSLEVAAIDKESTVVGADALSLGVSSTTELEAASRLVAYLDEHDAYPPGHGARVAGYAAELAFHLGFEGQARTRVQLAALLHDIGKVGLPAEVVSGPDGLDGELAEAYRSHPVRGAAYLRTSAGAEVADAVRAHHERWDGTGYPDGLAGEQIPVAARIIAVADAFDQALADPPDQPGTGPAAALATLHEAAGTRLDPALVEQAAPVLGRLVARRTDAAPAPLSAA